MSQTLYAVCGSYGKQFSARNTKGLNEKIRLIKFMVVLRLRNSLNIFGRAFAMLPQSMFGLGTYVATSFL